MKNYGLYILSIGTVMAFAVGLSSCKDDEPPAKPKLSFAESTMTVAEGAGTIEVELLLDKPYSKNLRIEYNLGGTAKDQDAVGSADADYEVGGTHGVVEIESGATSGVIELELYDDAAFEEDETIEVTIGDTNTGDIEVTEDDHIVVTITNDDAPVKASFVNTTMTVNEADGLTVGLVSVPVQLDKPAPVDLTVEYTLAGTAYDSTYAYQHNPRIPSAYYDYFINTPHEQYGKLVIPKGATTANIEIGLRSDFLFEDDETIEITLKPGIAQIDANNKITITLLQQDGKVIALEWDDDSYTDVDMDLFLWTGNDIANLDLILAVSNFADVEQKFELVFIPSVVTGGTFGLSHTYYSGSANPMAFTVRFIDFADGQPEAEADEDVFTATYTDANLNPYETTKVNPAIVQTFKIVDGAYVDITDITVPTSGSRVRMPSLRGGLKQNRMSLPRRSL
jgi:hypothetical protein